MTAKVENEYGMITIDNEVIARVAGLAATDCYGVVGMAVKNVKDGIVQLLKKDSLTEGIKLAVDDEKINIDLHIIVEYGTNITAIAETISGTVRYKVEDSTGLSVQNVNIFVEGIRVDN